MFKYQLLKMIRDKGFLFWSFFFPIALMTCFHFAFANLYDIENTFEPVAAVCVRSEDSKIADIIERLLNREEFAELQKEGIINEILTLAREGKEEEMLRLFEENGRELPAVTLTEEEAKEFADCLYEMIFYRALSGASDKSAKTQCFTLCTAASLDEARSMLENGEKTVLFYIVDGDIRVELSKEYSSVELNVVNSFVRSFKTQYAITVYEMENNFELAKRNDKTSRKTAGETGSKIEEGTTDNAASIYFDSENISQTSYVKAKTNVFEEETNPYNWYYYSTLVMGIMFNILTGISIVGDTQADVSRGALRINVSSRKKSDILLQAFLARFLVTFVISSLHLLLINYVFQVPLGNRVLQLLLFVAAANLFALSLGEFLGLIFKGKISERQSKANALLLTSVFLSGEMVCTLPGFFELYCPVVNRMNPATILNFALYNLVYYEDLTLFYRNLLIISGAALILLVYSALRMRKQKYEQI